MPNSMYNYSLSGSAQVFIVMAIIAITLVALSMNLETKVSVDTVADIDTDPDIEPKTEEVEIKDYGSQSKLIITEDGIYRGGNTGEFNAWYKNMREGYIIAPDLYRCYEDNKPEYCSGHAPKSGWGYMYDVKLGPNLLRGGSKYTQCLDGGHGCWYVEKYVDGKLTMIRNNQNIGLPQKMADDLWGGQWNLEDPYIKETVPTEYKLVESEDGVRIDMYKTIKQRGEFIDVKMTPANSSVGMYLTYFLLLMRLNGEPKPNQIVLDIKGIRQPYEGRP